MKLKIISSSSKGNAYLLENHNEALLIECGVKFDQIKQAARFNLRKIVGCLITHEHLDHCGAVNDVLKSGIEVHATEGTLKAMGVYDHHRAVEIVELIPTHLGGFRVIGFKVVHDAAQPVGFLINHAETGNVLFLTDTVYSPYTFKNLNNVIIEANYCEQVLEKRLEEEKIEKFLRDRVIESHLSIQNCKTLLKANDLSTVNNIVLIHLSDNHSDAERFKTEVSGLTGKTVTIADKGVEIEFNKTAF